MPAAPAPHPRARGNSPQAEEPSYPSTVCRQSWGAEVGGRERIGPLGCDPSKRAGLQCPDLDGWQGQGRGACAPEVGGWTHRQVAAGVQPSSGLALGPSSWETDGHREGSPGKEGSARTEAQSLLGARFSASDS